MTSGQQVLRFFQTRVVQGGIIVVSLVVAAGVFRSVGTIWEKRGIVAERKAVLKAEQDKQASLERQLREATSAAFIERTAREKLGLVKPEEQVVIMDRTHPPAGGLNDPKTIQEFPSWKQWWKLFF